MRPLNILNESVLDKHVDMYINIFCSAGIGRTGTFIAFDNLVAQVNVEGVLRPFQMVEALRRQRINMVQTAVRQQTHV